MKKFFIPLFILFSFFFIKNVNAYTFDYDNFNINDTDFNNLILVRNYLDENTTKPYNIIKVSNGYGVLFFNDNSAHTGDWYIITDKSSTKQYFVMYGYGVLDNNDKITQNNYSNMIQDKPDANTQAPVLPFNATSSQLDTFLNSLDSVISSTYYGNQLITYNFSTTDFDLVVDSSNNSYYPIYSSFDLPVVSRNTSGLSFNSTTIIYNGEETSLSNLDFFVPYINLLTMDTTLPPTFNDFGDGQYGFITNSIKISDLNTDIDSVNCPKDTSFINDFCYTNFGNYPTDNDLYNAQLIIEFNLMNNVPYRDGDYYVLTIRFDSPTLYLPSSASIRSGNITIPISIIKTNVINNGTYKDLQIVLHTNQQFGSNINLTSVALLFPSLSSYNPNPLSWQYGLFKSYKWSGVGNTLPDDNILSKDYNNNNLDGIRSSDKSWFDKFNINDRGLSSFVTSPIRLFQSMRNSTCSDIELPLPHFGNIKLPCISSIFSSNLPVLFNIYQVIMSGIICYYVGINYFRIIKNAFNPEDDRIEVQDL